MRYWDWLTFGLYLFIGFNIVFFTYFPENKCRKLTHKSCKKYNEVGWISYTYLFVLLVFVASFRYVGGTLGGADALVYINYFQNPPIINFNLNNFLTLNQTEPLFFILAGFVRKFTDNYIIFFIVYYSVIAYSYIKFISKQFEKKMNYIPLLYVVLPFLNSFNTMRSAMAMAIILLAYNAMTEKRDKKAIILMIIAASFHFTSLIVMAFYIFYKVVNSKIFNKKKWAVFFILFVYLFFYFGGSIVSNIIGSTKYDIYLDQQNSLVGQIIIIIGGLLSILYFNELKSRMAHKSVLLWAVIFNLMMIPLMINFGFFRLNNYFVFPRLLIWSYIIGVIKEKISKRTDLGPLVDVFAFFVALIWTIFRISRDWYPEGVMPYFNILFM